MPVEIKELVIRAVVARGAAEDEGIAAQGSQPAVGAEEIVQECVRQVLRILTRDKER